MPTVLSVAEKPSVAKELARIIGGDHVHRRAGFSHFNQLFEIPDCEFKNSRCSMTITSVTGHMMEVEFDPAYKVWSSCQPVDLFHAPISKSVKSESKDIEKTLVAESRKCDTLLLWLDGDLEGENICFEVMQVCLKANPRLDVYRARFSALIQRDIFRTLRMPERPNKVRRRKIISIPVFLIFSWCLHYLIPTTLIVTFKRFALTLPVISPRNSILSLIFSIHFYFFLFLLYH